jgi:hypothetical protein
LTPAILPGVNGRPILASAEFSVIDNPLSGDRLSETGAAHTIAALINTPMMLIFFMAVSRLVLQKDSRALALIQVEEWAFLRVGRYLRNQVDIAFHSSQSKNAAVRRHVSFCAQ